MYSNRISPQKINNTLYTLCDYFTKNFQTILFGERIIVNDNNQVRRNSRVRICLLQIIYYVRRVQGTVDELELKSGRLKIRSRANRNTYL